MGRKKLSEIEKAQVLTKEEHSVFVSEIAEGLKANRLQVDEGCKRSTKRHCTKAKNWF